MASSEYSFLDVVTDYSKDIQSATSSLFDASDRHLAWLAGYVKRQLPEGWLPEKPQPMPSSPPPLPGAQAYLQRVEDWISRNRALTAAVVAFVSTGGLLLWRESVLYRRKRRARRASNGARQEVVVLAGPPNSPITRSLSLDLERRGFIVYVVCSTMDEEQQVLGESRVDLRPLRLDVVDTVGTRETVNRFHTTLTRPHVAFAGASPHRLNLRGVVLVPDLVFPMGPVETVSPELWSDALNAKVLYTIAVTQALLPTICSFKARVLMLTPSIISSLRPPFHSVETTIVSALEGFCASLRAELGTLGIDVVQFHLGAFDFSNVGPRSQVQARAISPVSWPAATRALYAGNFEKQTRAVQGRGLVHDSSRVGSSMRSLHKAVFDALTQRRGRAVWRVGRGSWTYDMAGRWLPRGLVGWMMGLRRVSVGTGRAAREREEDAGDSSVHSWEKIEGADAAGAAAAD